MYSNTFIQKGIIKPQSIEVIVRRYNESISDITEYKRNVLAYNDEMAEVSIRHAGESMSECLEYAMRKHLHQVDEARYKYMYKSGAPDIIKAAYWDGKNCIDDALDTLDGTPSNVDFDFLMKGKFRLINHAKHHGGNVDFTVFNNYEQEVKKFILQYLDADADLKDEAYFNQPKYDMIQKFYSACEKFRRDERRYILLADTIDESKVFYRNISRVKWDAIIDFNRTSMDDGLAFIAFSGNLLSHIFKTTDNLTDDSIPTYTETPILYFANGYRDVPAQKSFKDWNKNNFKAVDGFVNKYAKTSHAQMTVVVSLMKDPAKLNAMIDIIERNLDNVRFVIANDRESLLADFCNNHIYSEDITHVAISMAEIDSCLNEYLPEVSKVSRGTVYKLPCLSDQVDGLITREQLALLEEYFEVLYEGIDSDIDDSEAAFLSGETKLTWAGAKSQFAAERSRMRQLYFKTFDEEIRKCHGKLMMVHDPGFGGTTVARQIAYYYHHDYPVLMMKRYNLVKVRELLDIVHSVTRKTVIIFMEVPSVISMEDFNLLYNKTNMARPFLFVGVRRGSYHPGSENLYVSDWGSDANILRLKFSRYLDRLPETKRKEKEAEMLRIVTGSDVEPYMKTPFYFGWLTFAENFKAMDNYLDHFAKAVAGKEQQRRALIYICLMNVYAERGLLDSFLRVVFDVPQRDRIFHLEDYFVEDDGVLNSLLVSEWRDGYCFRSLKYPYFGKKLLGMLLSNGQGEDMGNLGDYCKSLIDDVARSSNQDYLQDYILKNLFIGSSNERMGQKFTRIIDDIQKQDKVNIFRMLHEKFPDNPHFVSHLARYYSFVERNTPLSLEYAEKAIALSPSDPILHHIKAMCLLSELTMKAGNVVTAMSHGIPPKAEDINEIVNTIFPEASEEFRKSRELSYEKEEHGYIPNIKLLLRMFDFYVAVNKESKIRVVAEAVSPYIDWLEEAQCLLDEARSLYFEGEESTYYTDVEMLTWKEYDDFSTLINNLSNKLDKTPNKTLVRRQLARIYMHRDDKFKTTAKDNARILALMEQNILEEPSNDKNFLIWFSAARYSSHSLDEILAKATRWKSLNPSVDITFYCYVLNVLKALNNSTENVTIALSLEKECKRISATEDIRIREWLSTAPHNITTNKEYRENRDNIKLLTVEGYVSDYKNAGAAEITLDCGLKVFFRPSESKLTASCLNHKVEFCLGFSYDGLRAQDGSVVEIVD